jgi:quinolinate synthase
MREWDILTADTRREAERLFEILGKVTDFKTGLKYDISSCRVLAPLTLEINKLKKETNSVVLAHYYCNPDIVYGVSDFRGDSYALSKAAGGAAAENIIFCGVCFMAQTAKIINPAKRVFLPAVTAGCSLADSIDADEIKTLRAKYPGAVFICYINSTAEVKAQCDICVTSSNVYDIAATAKEEQIVFVPDVFMADNIKAEMARRGVKKEIIAAGGTCCVHDKYTVQEAREIRAKYTDAKLICHPECARPVCELCDYCGSTSGMLKYVKENGAGSFAVMSEDGILNCLERENPSKSFIRVSKTCAQMKRNNLHNILVVLKNTHNSPAEVKVNADTASAAKKCIDRMFEVAK